MYTKKKNIRKCRAMIFVCACQFLRQKKGVSASNILSVFNTLSEALQTESYRALPGGKPLTLALHCCDCGRWFDVALLTPFASLTD